MPFADILGHDRIVEILRRSIRTGKTAHAYIFEGIPGCGRRKTAIALIQALYCRESQDDACGVCSSCRKVSSGNHGDIHLVEPLPDKRDISIAQLRELQRELALKPYEAPRKACILEPAERMNVSSANSFLKTLEEPPGNAIIIMLTENADMLLPTIRSRCQLLRFSPLSEEHVCLLLEKSGVESSAAAFAAQMAEGSMQKAVITDNESLSERKALLCQYLEQLDMRHIASVFDAAESLSGNRDETLEMLDIMLSMVRDAVITTSGCKSPQNRLQNGIGALPLERILQVSEEILDTRRAVQRNANAKLALDTLLMRIAAITA